MRTTLTIDDDVAFNLNEMQKSDPNKPFKVLVNETLRRGLSVADHTIDKPFVIKSRSIGISKNIDLTSIEDALDMIEGKDRKW